MALSIAWQGYFYYISLTGTLFCGETETNRAPLGVGLTIGQIGQMPGASCFWGARAFGGLELECQNTPFLVFHVFRLFTTRKDCSFLLLLLVYMLMKLATLAFIVFE